MAHIFPYQLSAISISFGISFANEIIACVVRNDYMVVLVDIIHRPYNTHNCYSYY